MDVIQDLATRTAGDVFIGVVGPVRTGKSTFIKRFMEQLIIPRIADDDARRRAVDELPQSGAGRTVMTVEPKFVPDEAVAITVGEGLTVRVRLADSVGFPVPGAKGYDEEDGPRMVMTPWSEEPMPFEEAAEVGTRKIITDHSTLGVIVTTDGSIGDLSRDAFVDAEERTVREVQAVGRPFVVVLNSIRPRTAYVRELAQELSDRYGAPVLPLNVATAGEADMTMVLLELLYEFPVTEFNVHLPPWLQELDADHWLRRRYEDAVAGAVQGVQRLRDVEAAVASLDQAEFLEKATLAGVDMATGVVSVVLTAPEELFWQVAEEISGFNISGKEVLLRLLRELSEAKRDHEKFGSALRDARETGFGLVTPSIEDMTFEEPELIRKGNQFGVRLRATAATFQFMRADVSSEVTPIIGTEKQSEQLVNYLMEKFEDDPRKIWESDIFGKPLSDLLREGIRDKIMATPANAQAKLRETLERIINEGSSGLICIII
ncbi:MAG TPA: stage IV sporulation protein A [Sphingobacteriaceae bacterium]|nr:stage IV sporulation protein A [Sphingobacteriaceae bacterium]